jgi:hypothetical protein
MRTMTLGLADRYRCCHGAWGVLRLCVSSGSSTYGFICDRVRENPVSFVFGNASPDAVRLSKPQRVFEALNADGHWVQNRLASCTRLRRLIPRSPSGWKNTEGSVPRQRASRRQPQV